MEAIIVLVVIALPLAAFVGCVAGLIAISRTKKLANEIRSTRGSAAGEDLLAVDRRLRTLERRLDRLEELQPVDETTAPPEPSEADVIQEPEVRPGPPIPTASETAPELGWTDNLELQGADSAATTPETPKAPPSKSTHRPGRTMSWERWIGVRGAAAAGGVILALAAILFFQYSIEHGLISPTMRVAAGVLAGIGCLTGSELLRSRRQAAAANALAGAGVVALYAAIWAAHVLYSLIGALPATVFLILITVVCVALAVVRRSQLVAVLGLLGGFSTPILVAADPAGPVALFGYILLLDLGLLWVARARGWPSLAILSLLATAVHQGLWIFSAMEPDRALLGLGVLIVFAFAFAALGGSKDRQGPLWRATRAGGVAIPFAFAIHFASAADLDVHLCALGTLLLVLSAGGCWLARTTVRGSDLASAAASLGVLSLWAAGQPLDVTAAWQLAAVTCLLTALFTTFAQRVATSSSWTAAALIDTGMMILAALLCGVQGVERPWPWLLVWIATGAGLFVLSLRPKRSAVVLAAGIVPPIGLLVYTIAHGRSAGGLPVDGLALVLVIWVMATHIVSLLVPDGAVRRWSDRTAACSALLVMPSAAALLAHHRSDGLLGLVLVGVLAALGGLAATRLQSGSWYLATTASSSFWLTVVFEESYSRVAAGAELGWPLTAIAGTVVLLTTWPVLAAGAFRRSRSAWWAAALAGPLSFIVLREAYIAHFGETAIGALPIVLAVLTLATAVAAIHRLETSPATLKSARVWLLAVTLCLVSIAIPMQLEHEWITIGWALNGLAVLLLWTRIDHAGLKWFGLGLLTAATLRLVANPAVLSYHLRGDTPVLNWISYTYLVPALAMVLSMKVLQAREVERLLPWEVRVYPRRRALAAAACGLAAIATVFVWVNLIIADVFSVGSSLELSFQRLPARDVTTSVAWAVFALIVLGLGVRSRSGTLRWLSLGLLIATLAKVFLHDLGELEDLYRVGSLVGLAMSLIVVSLVYQRFVFSVDPEVES